MTDDRVRLRTPWLDQEYARRFVPGPSPDPRFGDADPRGGSAPPANRPMRNQPAWVGVVYFAFGVTAVIVLGLAASGNTEALGLLITGPILLAITLYAARRLAATDQNPQVVPIVMGGLCLKLIGSFVRYRVAANLYGTGDFFDYDKWGRTIGAGLRHGHFITPPGRLAGTNFMRVLTGLIYFVTPSHLLSGFAVYGWLSFIGLLFFWRAYRVAMSTQHDLTYLKWLVLVPSLVYWPSAIGKDAFMVLAAGIAAYGVACLLVNRTTVGVVAISAGVGGMVMVRPHFALAVCGGLAFAIVVRRHRGDFLRTIISLAFVVGVGFVVVTAASSFFGISAFNQSSVTKSLTDASAQSSEGGSKFNPVVVTSPAKFPLALVTVLYRPLPYEAHSPQEMITAVEGMALVALTLRALRRILRAIRRGRQLPYVMYCLGALLVFIIAFSGFSNFGILARERSVIQPLFLVFLALPRDIDELLPDPSPVGKPDAPGIPRRALT
ncbi:MAG TPA: hypothetical protein VGP92_07285 [Acidimicrobiia bacterium]|nr:hypothetical protein [Acidimicrobiia bacterium]